MSFLIIIILFAVAWVVLILPKQRELKRHNAFVQSLDVGDEVMTGSGIYGTLVEVSEDMVLLQVAPGVEIKIARRAIASQVIDPSMVATDDTDKSEDKDSDA
jgi:preprotein translocase subunit YajC